MIITLISILIIAFGGLSLTYLFADEETFMWRLAVGNVIGSAVFGIVGFVLAMLFGLSVGTTIAAAVITLLPILLLRKEAYGRKFGRDWQSAKGKMQDGSIKRFADFAYYAVFVVLFWLFFGQTMYETSQGIFSGGSQNLGDLPFHLGAILGFTDGQNIPPMNPSFAGARFSYPFIADFLTASLMQFGAPVRDAMVGQDVSWALSLLVVLERFTQRLTGSKLAGRVAPFILFFSGGLGFAWFFKNFWDQGKGIWDFLWNLGRDYTINEEFRWGNPLLVLFMTQRSLLFGMPLTIMVLGKLWQIFTGDEVKAFASPDKDSNFRGVDRHLVTALLIGVCAGMLPLIHLHSLAVLFVVTGFLFIMRPAFWRSWVAFGVGVCILAVPELVWTMQGTATETSKFFGWHFGWVKNDANFFWFWFKQTGFTIPVLIAGLVLYWFSQRATGDDDAESPKPKFDLLLFYIPFAFLFLVSNVAKLAPWEWDNIKVLIYWLIGSIPFIAYAIAYLWERTRAFKVLAAACFLALIMSGGLDVWRTVTGQVKMGIFDADGVRVAEQIKTKLPAKALILNAPTYNSPVVLSGRQSYMRFSAHLMSHGIDYGPRETQVRQIYSGSAMADTLLRDAGIDYVMVSPEERNSMQANEEYFKKYPVVAESGPYKVYKVK